MRLLAIVLMGLLTVIVVAGMMAFELAGNWLAAVLIILVLQFVVIFVHECGHAVAARKRGARLEAFAVLGFEYDFRERKLGTARSRMDQEVGGFVLFSWEDREPTRRDDALIAAAGPAANMLLALLALAMSLSLSAVQFSRPLGAPPVVEAGTISPGRAQVVGLPDEAAMEAAFAHARQLRQLDRYDAAARWLEGFAAVLAVLSLGVGLLNLLPYAGSDGERLLAALSRERSRPGRSRG